MQIIFSIVGIIIIGLLSFVVEDTRVIFFVILLGIWGLQIQNNQLKKLIEQSRSN